MVHVAAKPTSTASSHPIKLAKLKLRRRAQTSGLLGFAPWGAAPIRALGPIKEPVRWYHSFGRPAP